MQENILSKQWSLGLNFSTPSGGVTSPSLKESMVLLDTSGGHFNPRYYTINSIVQAGVEMSNFDTKSRHFNPRQFNPDISTPDVSTPLYKQTCHAYIATDKI